MGLDWLRLKVCRQLRTLLGSNPGGQPRTSLRAGHDAGSRSNYRRELMVGTFCARSQNNPRVQRSVVKAAEGAQGSSTAVPASLRVR